MEWNSGILEPAQWNGPQNRKFDTKNKDGGHVLIHTLNLRNSRQGQMLCSIQ